MNLKPASCFLPAVAIATALSALLVGGRAETASSAGTYTLFMGADVLIERNKELHRVRDVSGGSLVINVKGEPVFVPVGGAPVSFQVDPQLKITGTSAVLDKFKYERAYTALNDPVRQFTREQSAARSTGQSSYAVYNMYGAQMAVRQAVQIYGQPVAIVDKMSPGQKTVALAERNLALAEGIQSRAFAAEAGRFNETSTHAGRLQKALDAEAYDAVEINFEAAADEPLNRPYVIVIAKFRAPEDAAGEIRKWIYAKELSPITAQSRTVHFLQGGFPAGFELKELQLRLYNAGREVATNLSPNRVALTLEEASKYVLIEYLSAHKNATLPATVALGKLPPDLLAHLPAARGQMVYYVRVSKDGLPLRTCLDPDGAEEVKDPYLTSIFAGLRFKPALEKGRPVEGMARVKLGELLTSL